MLSGPKTCHYIMMKSNSGPKKMLSRRGSVNQPVASAVHLSPLLFACLICCQSVPSAVPLSPLLSTFALLFVCVLCCQSVSSAVCLSPLRSGCCICCSLVSCAMFLLLHAVRKVLWTVYLSSSVCSFRHHVYLLALVHP